MEENELTRSIHACSKCESISGSRRVVLRGKKIPSDYGATPKDVKVVFVAESPPLSGRYFYRSSGSTSLDFSRQAFRDAC